MHSSKVISGMIAGMVGLLMLSACGKIESKNPQMSEQAAFKQLADLPASGSSSSSSSTSSSSASAGSVQSQPPTPQNLNSLLRTLIANGKIAVPPSKAQTNTNGALDLLTQILSLIQGGQANSVLSLVNVLLKAPDLKSGNIVSSIDFIISVLTAALPIITPIAPQFVPVVTALLAILPAVEAFLKLVIPTPTPTPSAYFPAFPIPVRA